MNADELKERARALTHTAIAMRAYADDPTMKVLWQNGKRWVSEQPKWTCGTDYCLAELQQGRVDWTLPDYGWQEVSGVLKTGEHVWCNAFPKGDSRNMEVTE